MARHHLKPDGFGQPDGLGEARLGVALGIGLARFGLDMDHESGAPEGLRRLTIGFHTQADSLTVSCSWSWIGPIGMTVEIACL